MFIDDVTIRIEAGNGGDGKVAFNKNLLSLGPAGGSGGNGGSVYALGVSDLSVLRQFRNKKEVYAEDGANGRGQFLDGRNGKDSVFLVPIGTIIHNLETKEDIEIVSVGEKVCVARGGHGGRGNFQFRSSRNTSPKRADRGRAGDAFTLRLELKLIADVGLIGLPNAGKSSLLNAVTNAQSKVANYPFTTLEPNLGAYYELILADIPGLIEGASHGKGLGMKFLRHIERTRILFHLVSSESENPAADYRTVRGELKQYNPALLKKEEYLFLTKSDLLSPTELEKKLKALKKLNKNAESISLYDEKSIAHVVKLLNAIKTEKLKGLG